MKTNIPKLLDLINHKSQLAASSSHHHSNSILAFINESAHDLALIYIFLHKKGQHFKSNLSSVLNHYHYHILILYYQWYIIQHFIQTNDVICFRILTINRNKFLHSIMRHSFSSRYLVPY